MHHIASQYCLVSYVQVMSAMPQNAGCNSASGFSAAGPFSSGKILRIWTFYEKLESSPAIPASDLVALLKINM